MDDRDEMIAELAATRAALARMRGMEEKIKQLEGEVSRLREALADALARLPTHPREKGGWRDE